jgi:hypothetical protein
MKITIDNIPPEKVNVIVHLLNDVLSNVSAGSKIEVSDAVTDFIHCFGKDDLRYVYEDVDTQFKSFENWYDEYILPI